MPNCRVKMKIENNIHNVSSTYSHSTSMAIVNVISKKKMNVKKLKRLNLQLLE